MEMPRPNPAVLAIKDRLVNRLTQVIPASAVIHDIAETRAYECDALTAYKCPPLLAVLPGSVDLLIVFGRSLCRISNPETQQRLSQT
mgnify:CR=1 FL=1